MNQNRAHFLVGLFVIAGLVLGVAAIIWVGASKYFEKGARYATYFDESVQGLQVDSTVRYRGVDIGRVEKIGVAPDQRLVEVVMKIDVANFLVEGVLARLSMAGITGIVYVELDRKRSGESFPTPKINFTPPYPVIPSSPSQIKQIQAAVNDILNDMKRMDLEGLVKQLSTTVKAIGDVVTGERMNKITMNISSASDHLASLTKRADEILAQGNVEKVLAGAKDAVEEARKTVISIRSEVESAKIGQVSGRMSQTVDSTSKKVQSAATQIEITAETLRRTSEALEILIDRIKADPSTLIFSSPPPKKGE